MAIIERLSFDEETSADRVAALFPYLKERFDALKEIREWEYDMSKISNFGRRFAKQGTLGRRIASIPWHICYHWKMTYGFDITQDKRLFHKWLETHPEYKAS